MKVLITEQNESKELTLYDGLTVCHIRIPLSCQAVYSTSIEIPEEQLHGVNDTDEEEVVQFCNHVLKSIKDMWANRFNETVNKMKAELK